MLVLIAMHGSRKGQVIELPETQIHVLGRQSCADANTITMSDTEVSRRHAQLYYEDDRWFLRDVGSTNGTFLNRQRITSSVELHNGDQIVIGKNLLAVGYTRQPGASNTPPLADSQAHQLVEAVEHLQPDHLKQASPDVEPQTACEAVQANDPQASSEAVLQAELLGDPSAEALVFDESERRCLIDDADSQDWLNEIDPSVNDAQPASIVAVEPDFDLFHAEPASTSCDVQSAEPLAAVLGADEASSRNSASSEATSLRVKPTVVIEPPHRPSRRRMVMLAVTTGFIAIVSALSFYLIKDLQQVQEQPARLVQSVETPKHEPTTVSTLSPVESGVESPAPQTDDAVQEAATKTITPVDPSSIASIKSEPIIEQPLADSAASPEVEADVQIQTLGPLSEKQAFVSPNNGPTLADAPAPIVDPTPIEIPAPSAPVVQPLVDSDIAAVESPPPPAASVEKIIPELIADPADQLALASPLSPSPSIALPDSVTPEVAPKVVEATPPAPAPINPLNLDSLAPNPSTIPVFGPFPIDPQPLDAAQRLVLLIDASGSQIDTLPLIVDHASRTLAKLRDDQQFTVIFFQSDRAIEAPPVGLKPADKQHHHTVSQWMKPGGGQILAAGSSNPVQALRLAVDYNPDQIIIYSDKITGPRPGQITRDALINLLDQITDHQPVQINTVHFFYDDPDRMLHRIANRYHGVYEFVAAPKGADEPNLLDLGAFEIIKH